MLTEPQTRNGTLTIAPLTDPLIAAARVVNDAIWLREEANRIERNLAARKALRNDPHARGWMTRRAV